MGESLPDRNRKIEHRNHKLFIFVCYCAALLISATLLFSAQPMIAKMVLPLYGGSPAVWTSCMVFYQVTLLAGYAYAHAISSWLSLKLQMIIHVVLIGLPLAVLPISISHNGTSASTSPVLVLATLLVVAAGAPLFVVTTTASLLQRWFAETTHSAADDPYSLYAVSNTGSIAALVSYPLLIERTMRLSDQAWLWAVGYVLLVVTIAICAAMTWRMSRGSNASGVLRKRVAAATTMSASISTRERAWWVLLAFLPSSWMLAVTARITTNIAPIPLLWTIPLALYLLTFVLTFARRQLVAHHLVIWLFPCLMILLALSLVVLGRWQLLAIHLAAFFAGAMVCHGELARRRPVVQHLTEFYWWMSVGGALGGVFNAIVAPLVFSVLLELPIMAALTCLILPLQYVARDRKMDMVALGITMGIGAWLIRSFEIRASPVIVSSVIAAVALLTVLSYYRQLKWFALVLSAMFVGVQFDAGPNRKVVHRTRSFFGVHHVAEDVPRRDPYTGKWLPRYRRLFHGTTQHGCQSLDPQRECEPLQYYHPSGPLGQIFDALSSNAEGLDQVAVVGLGTGAAACYASPDQFITFFEIDPVVQNLAENRDYFSYIGKCGGDNTRIVIGDGRLMIHAAPDKHYAMIMLDAFSSEAIPSHLLTREAIELYFRKLADNGMVTFHISNRYLDLSAVLAAVAADLQLHCIVFRDLAHSIEELNSKLRQGIEASTYVVMARQPEHLRGLQDRSHWRSLDPDRPTTAWTDQYSNIPSVLRWNPADVAQEE